MVLAAGARPRHGVEDLMTLYTKMFDHWPKHLDVPGRTFIDGNTVTVEVHFVGTTDDGRELEFDAVDVIDVEKGKIARLTNWYDTSKVRAMIAGQAVSGQGERTAQRSAAVIAGAVATMRGTPTSGATAITTPQISAAADADRPGAVHVGGHRLLRRGQRDHHAQPGQLDGPLVQARFGARVPRASSRNAATAPASWSISPCNADGATIGVGSSSRVLP